MPIFPYVKSQDIQRIYEDGNGVIIVEGVAADTGRDIVGDMASKNFLHKLAADLPNRPMYYNHNYKAPQIGRVLEATVTDDGNKLWAKGEIYTSDPDIRRSILNGSLRFFSVGAVGKEVIHDTINNLPTRIFNDGYAQELTVTGVPINPTAAFRIAKSFSGSESDGYNNDEEATLFVKAIAERYQDGEGKPLNIIEERKRILNQIEEHFMNTKYEKGENGAIMHPEYIDNKGHVNGRWDNLNPPAAQSTPGHGGFPEGQQLKPMSMEEIIRKSIMESTTLDDAVARIQWEFKKANAYGYDKLNGIGQTPGRDDFSGAGAGFMAQQVAQELAKLVRTESAPNYGTHPADAAFLRQQVSKLNFRERGYDDTFVDQSVSRAGVESLGPAGEGRNPGVHPLDQEFLTRGLKQLPPAAKTEGYVNGGFTNITKAADLLNDEKFMKSIHAVPENMDLYANQQETESDMQYVHRLLHVRPHTNINIRKAIDKEIVETINVTDFGDMSIVDTAIYEHIMDDFNHLDPFTKCMKDSAYWELYEGSEPSDYSKSMDNIDEDELEDLFLKANEDDDEDEDDKEGEDDEKDAKKKGKDKGKGKMPPWLMKKAAKNAEKDEEEDSEDEDEDEDEDDEEEGEKEFKRSLDAIVADAARERMMQEQSESVENNYIKGHSGRETVPVVAPKTADFDSVLKGLVLKGGGTAH